MFDKFLSVRYNLIQVFIEDLILGTVLDKIKYRWGVMIYTYNEVDSAGMV